MINRRDLLKASACVPTLGLVSASSAATLEPPGYVRPYFPVLWAATGASVIRRRLKDVRCKRSVIDRAAEPLDDFEHLYVAFDLWNLKPSPNLIRLQANILADRIIERVRTKGRHIQSYLMPIHNISQKPVSQSGRYVRWDLAVHGLLFNPSEAKKYRPQWCGVIEMNVGFARA